MYSRSRGNVVSQAVAKAVHVEAIGSVVRALVRED